MLRFFILKFFFGINFILIGQEYKNNIYLGFNSHVYFNVIEYDSHTIPIDLVSIGYKRNVFNNLFIIGNIKIPTGKLIGEFKSDVLTYENIGYDLLSINKIETRHDYYFIDLGIGKNLFSGINHKFSIAIGPSITIGKNSYLRTLVLAPPPPYGFGDVIYKKNEVLVEKYFGGFTSIAYDYFISNTFTIGINFSGRHYLNGFPKSIHYGFHFGYNFTKNLN